MSHFFYRIYYGDTIVYVGRTNQALQTRIRGHLFAKPMHRVIDINLVSKVEYHDFETEADMNLYEIYYILKLHPALNVDDKTRDCLTVSLPDVDFEKASFPLWDKWKAEISEKMCEEEKRRLRLKELIQLKSVLRKQKHDGEITADAFEDKYDEVCCEIEDLQKR